MRDGAELRTVPATTIGLRSPPKREIEVAASVLCAVALLPVVATFFELHWLLALSSHFVAQVAVSMCALAIGAAIVRRTRLTIASLVVALANSALVAPLYASPAGQTVAAGARLRLVMLNLNVSNREHARVREWIVEQRADVLLLIELSPAWRAALEPELMELDGRIELPRSDAFGIGLYARAPLRSLDHGLASPPAITATTVHQGVELTLVAVHPPPPVNSRMTQRRDAQLRALVPIVRGSAAPVILIGDLNTTSWSVVFRELSSAAGVIDTRAGFGVQGTWPAKWPALLRLPIDHALVSHGVQTRRRTVGPWLGSDHRPLVVDLALP